MDETMASFDTLVEYIESSAAAKNDDSSADSTIKPELLLLSIKETYGQLVSSLGQEQDKLLDKQKHLQRLERTITALRFERDHVQNQIQIARGFGTPKLLQMVRDEADKDETEQAVSDEWLLQKYFNLDNWNDEVHRDQVTAQIHQEIKTRTDASELLTARKEELDKLKKVLQEKRKLLENILPEQVAAMERSSLPLQTVFSLPMTSSERRDRLEQAQHLAPPLFTLFNQLQLYLDFIDSVKAEERDTNENSRASVKFIYHQNSNDDNGTRSDDQVLLHLPVPDLAATSGRSRRVTIHFHLVDNNQVVASASGCAALLVQDKILQELFPGDPGSETAHPPRRAYHWCNYMAGMYPVGIPPALPSTRGILLQLNRRIHASATLKYILTCLQQRKLVPDVPGYKEAESVSLVKIASFEENPKDSSNDLVALWTCKLGNDGTFRTFNVHIDMARYPVTPPVWDIQHTSATDNLTDGLSKGQSFPSSTTMYDEKLAALEEAVNETSLKMLSSPESSVACEWILAVQVKQILNACHDMDSSKGAVPRKRKSSGQ